MVTRTEWYARVNAAWPKELPPLTAEAAVNAARRLYRWGTGVTWTGPVVVTSGRRRTWMRWDRKTQQRTLFVNPSQGWHDFIHDLSHYLHDRMNPQVKAHHKTHAQVELAMIKQVVKRGWLAPETVPAPAVKPDLSDVRQAKLERIEARISSWERKAKRAANALKKLEKQRRYYVKALGKE